MTGFIRLLNKNGKLENLPTFVKAENCVQPMEIDNFMQENKRFTLKHRSKSVFNSEISIPPNPYTQPPSFARSFRQKHISPTLKKSNPQTRSPEIYSDNRTRPNIFSLPEMEETPAEQIRTFSLNRSQRVSTDSNSSLPGIIPVDSTPPNKCVRKAIIKEGPPRLELETPTEKPTIKVNLKPFSQLGEITDDLVDDEVLFRRDKKNQIFPLTKVEFNCLPEYLRRHFPTLDDLNRKIQKLNELIVAEDLAELSLEHLQTIQSDSRSLRLCLSQMNRIQFSVEKLNHYKIV